MKFTSLLDPSLVIIAILSLVVLYLGVENIFKEITGNYGNTTDVGDVWWLPASFCSREIAFFTQCFNLFNLAMLCHLRGKFVVFKALKRLTNVAFPIPTRLRTSPM